MYKHITHLRLHIFNNIVLYFEHSKNCTQILTNHKITQIRVRFWKCIKNVFKLRNKQNNYSNVKELFSKNTTIDDNLSNNYHIKKSYKQIYINSINYEIKIV